MHEVSTVHERDVAVTTGRRDALHRGQAGKRLFAQYVFAAAGRCDADFFSHAGRCRDVDGIDVSGIDHRPPGVEGIGHAVFSGEFLRSFHSTAGYCGQGGEFGQLDHVRHPIGDSTGADDAPSESFHGLCSCISRSV